MFAPPSAGVVSASLTKTYCVSGNEDCLWLNVFTRDLVVRKSRPVIVWIHGGNFVRGSAAEYEPDYILDDDNVVLVTIQYRLGMFGFLSTEDPTLPGNYGMLDQVMSLPGTVGPVALAEVQLSRDC